MDLKAGRGRFSRRGFWCDSTGEAARFKNPALIDIPIIKHKVRAVKRCQADVMQAKFSQGAGGMPALTPPSVRSVVTSPCEHNVIKSLWIIYGIIVVGETSIYSKWVN
jgi:hypothetical protein